MTRTRLSGGVGRRRVLTSVVGGVVNEPIRFDLKVLAYPLSEPTSAVRSITGTSNGLPRTFFVAIDLVFSGIATGTVVSLDDATKPDEDTTFFVDYFRVESRSPRDRDRSCSSRPSPAPGSHRQFDTRSVDRVIPEGRRQRVTQTCNSGVQAQSR